MAEGRAEAETNLRRWWCRAFARCSGWGTAGMPFLAQLHQSLKCLLLSPAVVATTLTGIEVCSFQATINKLQHGHWLSLGEGEGANLNIFFSISFFFLRGEPLRSMETSLALPNDVCAQNSI